jgi:NADH-quinone oxidoreductase subunit G
MVSPMLPCEEAYLLARAARTLDPEATFALGPIPHEGADKTFPGGYTIRAEKCPNSRGVRRVLEAVAGDGAVLSCEDAEKNLAAGRFTGAIITGNYPSEWVTEEFAVACKDTFVLLIDTLPNHLSEQANVILPGATWAEKAGVFENADSRLQAFEQAIPVLAGAQCEGQIAMDLMAVVEGAPVSEIRADATVLVVDEQAGQVPAATSVIVPRATLRYNAANVRREIAAEFAALSRLETDVHYAAGEGRQEADMEVVEL